jgi:putative redox protein
MSDDKGREGRARTGKGKFGTEIDLGPHHLVADEPVAAGGDDTGPAPHDFLLAALGSCTAMTVKMYAERKGWAIRAVDVKLTQGKVDGVHVIHREVHFDGELDDEQLARLLEIANKCPVHKTLTGKIAIETKPF